MSHLRRISYVVHVELEKLVDNTHPKKSIMSTSKAFELIHMDLFGPTHTLALMETNTDL